MNREDVMRMAMRAGLLDRVDCSNDYFIPADAFIDEMEKLANLAYEAGRKDENEGCAKEIDKWIGCDLLAAAIRARREQ